MYKFFSLIPVVFLSSCLFSNNIIVDEADADSKQQPIEEGSIEKNDSVEIIDDSIEIVDERKVIAREDANFLINDLNTGIDDENFVYQFSGVTKESSNNAKVKVAQLKQEHSDLVFVLYFDFDSDELSNVNKETIVLHEEFMQKNPELLLTLEGNTDIKGSREYNLSLGEKRALAVKKVIDVTNNIETISFGEEKIVSIIDSENRRVEFVYK